MSNTHGQTQQILLLRSLTGISQIACLKSEAQPKEVTMAQRKSKSENSVNIKYSSVTGELVIDGVSMGMFVDQDGKHPTAEEMQTIVRLVQQRLPFDSKLVDNMKSNKPKGGRNDDKSTS